MIPEPVVPHPHLVLQAVGTAIITANAQGLIDYLNPAAEEMTGWRLEDAKGRRVESILSIVDEHGRNRRPLTALQCEKGQATNLPQYGQLISRSGKAFTIQHSSSLLCDEHGRVVGTVLIFSDVTKTPSRWQEEMRPAAHDPLTGLVNRHELERRLDRALTSAQEQGARHMLGYLDLDNFQLVNDSCGHDVGDALLKQLARLLRGTLRARDTLARIGGDSFSLLLENCPEHRAKQIAEAMIAAVRQVTFCVGGRQRALGASIGLVPVTAERHNLRQLFSQADLACSTAKRRGHNQVHIYASNREAVDTVPSRSAHLARLQDALDHNRFELYAQPIVALSSQAERPLHYELLLRLVDRRNQIILPESFIPTAERYGLMTVIDRWVIHTALHDAAAVLNSIPQSGIVINLSGTSLNDGTLLNFLRDQLATSAVVANRICFEITETAAINSLMDAAQLINAIKAMGCRFALDDFGSGLSSFAYLKHLPVDYLKIDGSFVRDMIEDNVDQAIVVAMNKVGHLMGIQTIAECVETTAIVRKLKTLGIDYAQGYTIGRPRPLHSVAH